MMRTSDSRAAARLRPAHRVVDGLGKLAECVGAYTINVPGRGVQPRQGKLLAETFRRRAGDAQALILNRTTSTSRVPSSSVRRRYAELPDRNFLKRRYGTLGRLPDRIGRLY